MATPSALRPAEGVSLDTLAQDPGRVRDLPPDVAQDLLARVMALSPLLLVAALREDGPPEPEVGEDRLLRVPEVARRLGVSTDTVYRNKWPFEVSQGGRRRFSANGLARYLRQRTARG